MLSVTLYLNEVSSLSIPIIWSVMTVKRPNSIFFATAFDSVEQLALSFGVDVFFYHVLYCLNVPNISTSKYGNGMLLQRPWPAYSQVPRTNRN